MLNIKTSLATISHDYTVFEEDQVLTHEQLNGVTDYLTDQDRLTRVDLVGVGIYAGLRATLAGDRVGLTRGVGVTTDGDIARVPANLEYTKYKRYDDTAPRYEVLRPGGTPLKTWELLPDTTTDPRAAPLNRFEAVEGVALPSMSALILVESVDLDNDICSDTNCDSRGDRATETLRLLLLDAASAASIVGALDTPAAAAPRLDVIVIDRPVMAGVTTSGELAARYRTACTAIQKQLAAALPKLHKHAGRFLWEQDPTPGWLEKLAALGSSFDSSGSGIQYYHGCLRDIVETYAQLREQLSDDSAFLLPALNSFPKHLVLGRIVPGSGTDARIDFYPSPVVRAAVRWWGHARFLARKLGVLISAWKLPAADGRVTAAIRITPSVFGDRSLEDRAIPYYYDPEYVPAVRECWSFALSQRQMERYNYSYHAAETGGHGDAARPLESNLGRFTFFRIEGQLGRNVAEVLAVLEGKIRQYNLPITLATGLLRATAPERKTSARDLRVAYDALRTQIVSQIDQAAMVARRTASRLGDTSVRGGEGASAMPAALELEQQAAAARAGLAIAYDDAQGQAAWRTGVEAAIRSAAEFRDKAGGVMAPVEALPVDTLVKSAPLSNLELFRAAIREEEEGSNHPLFGGHLEQQPGLEHFAGASRGTTLLLVHDENDLVIADFMLPCCNCEVVSERDQNAGGAREAVSAVYAMSSPIEQLVVKGCEVPAHALANGLRLVPSPDMKFDPDMKPDCSVALELPTSGSESRLGFSRIVVNDAVSMMNGNLLWNPRYDVANWLRNRIADAVGPEPMDLLVNDDPAAPGWRYAPPDPLAYQNSHALLRGEQPISGGIAVYQQPADSDAIVVRFQWQHGMQEPAQVGFIHDFQSPTEFSMLLCDAFIYVEDDRPPRRYRKLGLSLVVVQSGIAHVSSVLLTGPGRRIDLNTPNPKHLPIEIHLESGKVRINDVSPDLVWKFEFQTNWTVSGRRIGVFTTVPTVFEEFSNNEALSLHKRRIRTRLRLDRGAMTWAGPPGMMRPFVPDYDSWFWLRVSWPGASGDGALELHRESGGVAKDPATVVDPDRAEGPS